MYRLNANTICRTEMSDPLSRDHMSQYWVWRGGGAKVKQPSSNWRPNAHFICKSQEVIKDPKLEDQNLHGYALPGLTHKNVCSGDCIEGNSESVIPSRLWKSRVIPVVYWSDRDENWMIKSHKERTRTNRTSSTISMILFCIISVI